MVILNVFSECVRIHATSSWNLSFSAVPECPLQELNSLSSLITNVSLPILIYCIFCFQILASILYQAARDRGYVNPEKVEEILGVKQSEVTGLSKEVTSQPTGQYYYSRAYDHSYFFYIDYSR